MQQPLTFSYCNMRCWGRKKRKGPALAGVAPWIEHWPVNLRVAGSIPSQGTCLGCGPGPQVGACNRQLIDV